MHFLSHLNVAIISATRPRVPLKVIVLVTVPPEPESITFLALYWLHPAAVTARAVKSGETELIVLVAVVHDEITCNAMPLPVAVVAELLKTFVLALVGALDVLSACVTPVSTKME